MLLGMPFLEATNPHIDWTSATFENKIEASTIDAYHKPLAKRAISASSMTQVLQEERYQDIYSKYVNEEPKIRRTTKATELAAEKADNTL